MGYSYRDMSCDIDLQDYQSSFSKNNLEKKLENLRWVHEDNLLKKTMTTIVRDDNEEIATIYATLPVVAEIDRQVVTACQSLDTLTDRDHRGRGLFIRAAKKRYKACAEDGVAFVYGFPNGSSVRGFSSRHLNWKLLDPVPFLIKPLRSGYFLQKLFGVNVSRYLDIQIFSKKNVSLPNGISIKSMKFFDSDVDLLWERFAEKISVCIRRDAKYLNWRYIRKPGEDYKIIGLYQNESLTGFVVFTCKKKHGGKIGYVMELVVDPDYEEFGNLLIDFANNHFIDSECDAALAWCFDFSPNYTAYKAGKYISLPVKFRPIELHFGYANFNSDESVLSDRSNWYLSYSDSDTV